jgi:hypothetical protein
MQSVAAWVLLVTAFLVGGCSVSACRDSEAYMASKATDPLRMPEGVEPPDTTSAVNIPGEIPDGQGGAKRSSDGCLAEPPQFYGDTTEAVEAGLPARPGAAAAEGSSGQGSGPLAGASRLTLDVVAFLDQWADAWNRRDADAWLAHYESDFAPAGYGSHAEWRDAQRKRFELPAATTIVKESVEVNTETDGRVLAKFVQKFGETDERNVVKELVLVPRSGSSEWRIASERIVEVL